MPLEPIVLVFVLVAFVAIIARFLPRDAAGRPRLPRIVDESVGMYVLRRSLGRPTEAASDLAKVEVDATADVPEDEIAYRIGVPGAPEPTIPTRFVVSQAPPQAHPIPPVVPITARPVVGGGPQARRRGAALVPLQRRIAGLGTLVAILLVGFAAVSVPRAPRGSGAFGDGDAWCHAGRERTRVRADVVPDRGAACERAAADGRFVTHCGPDCEPHRHAAAGHRDAGRVPHAATHAAADPAADTHHARTHAAADPGAHPAPTPAPTPSRPRRRLRRSRPLHVRRRA